MATFSKTDPPAQSPSRTRIFGRIRLGALLAMTVLLVVCAVFSWVTRDAMVQLQFLRKQGGVGVKKALVDLSPWETAQALAPLAVSAEEIEYAHNAARLADHEVDQAFASALRMARLQAEHRVLTGDALALSQKVAQLQQLVKQDQALVASFAPKAAPDAKSGAAQGTDSANQDDLEIAKAQLGLESDELAEAQSDLERASGDNSSQIQGELAAHEATMKKFDSEVAGDGQVAVLSEKRHGTLSARIKAWFSQRSRYQLLQQALQQTHADIAMLTGEHKDLEAKANASKVTAVGQTGDRAAALANLKERSVERQILSILDDRIQTEQQLATIYSKWSAQVMLQHRIVFHVMLQSAMLIVVVGLCMSLGDALVRHLMSRPSLDRRQAQTLRSILQLSVQILGAGIILLIVFGSPQQVPTILGLATAALTIALQDFILAFLGWFVLVGKNGIHVGDAVEINDVSGEVSEVGLFSTTLLETGDATGKGQLTGRRISLLNSFAIRGKYFNFSTSGQWLWDEITVSIPASADFHALTERISQEVSAETKENAALAELDWKRGRKGLSEIPLSAEPLLSMRPTSGGIEVAIRYVARATDRFEVRNRLNQRLIDLLHQPVDEATKTSEAGAAH